MDILSDSLIEIILLLNPPSAINFLATCTAYKQRDDFWKLIALEIGLDVINRTACEACLEWLRIHSQFSLIMSEGERMHVPDWSKYIHDRRVLLNKDKELRDESPGCRIPIHYVEWRCIRAQEIEREKSDYYELREFSVADYLLNKNIIECYTDGKVILALKFCYFGDKGDRRLICDQTDANFGSIYRFYDGEIENKTASNLLQELTKKRFYEEIAPKYTIFGEYRGK